MKNENIENELRARISAMEAEIKKLKSRKKYGLVWEDKPEDVVLECRENIPILKEVKGKEIRTDKNKPTNILIEGDNYHALSVLNYTHQGKIDVIYIDPPYNTGAKNWKYNNDYVDKDDTYRHSKWLSMMQSRLVLAKRLLTEDGVLVCAIDENEHSHMSVQIEEIFSAFERHSVVVVHNPKGVQGNNFSYTHEYAVFVIPKNKKTIIDRTLKESEMYVSNLRNWGNESARTDAKNCFYPIIVQGDKIVGFGEVASDKIHPESSNEIRGDKIYVWPIDEKKVERKWRYARQSVEEIIDVLRVEKTKKGTIQILIAKDYGTHKTVWNDKRYDASEYGTKLLREIIPNCTFDFPKSLYTVLDCVSAVIGNKKDSTVLDFFAGSGTTGHAVMELNKEDGGNRQFILCTNNENNICEEVTYERIKRVAKGYKNLKGEKVAGLGGNLKYFKTAFVKKSLSRDDLKMRLTSECTELLCLREGIFSEVKNTEDYRIFEDGGRILAVYSSLDYSGLPALKKTLDKMTGEKILYCFSLDSAGLNKEEFVGWNDVVLESIPQKILDLYKQIYEY